MNLEVSNCCREAPGTIKTTAWHPGVSSGLGIRESKVSGLLRLNAPTHSIEGSKVDYYWALEYHTLILFS